ncbi:MAG: 50S ribosomal protein L25 [Saprospiraceae bacterium]|jgi:large subunit ribosomal protein L25|uniref:50S ribosomal protein L25 n=1 Tax=Candidatus Brachybacter algidus TaxID=2982024 RepID=UPI001B4D814A|nr:50S ribosomal protein L25 [Candidatus Brachybacter algidus]MBP7304498.1 50S ribosomal protein L25 [Saprospiraceae bacterium]MBK6372423.1 50S ribosomal protein L25 [Candidatus Brachybacter algidus]MBK6450250.1 50S ribosomal protein L25 [Candidatus Brachybacter algidus]MBK7603169.1 50S ribosomal protein L25 [Candidatus Brachybacter algidus]MBK8356567.1 50S ribosomal protein L25 [Candidatus Brachybacter algidus]
MNSMTIKGTPRTDVGKKATKAVRASAGIPCVLYGSKEVIHFQTTESELRHLVFTGDFKVAELDIEGKKVRSILKAIQFHPVKDNIVHVDFLELVAGQAVKLEIPLKPRGSSPGVKLGGKLIQSVRKVKVKTTPEKMVDELFVDISGLELGQSLRIKDIIAVDGIDIQQNASIPVVSIEIPRALRSAAAKE